MDVAGVRRELDVWLQMIRQGVEQGSPGLVPIFEDYAGEARFGLDIIAGDLARIPAGASILEIGAGMGLLSALLQRVGFQVVAIEPIGEGFSHLDRLRDIVLDTARAHGCAPSFQDIAAESLVLENCFDYAFSINVMEHVRSVQSVMKRVFAAMKPGARYRFVCPNYLFPFEPHFNILTLGSKRLTGLLFGPWIFKSKKVADPEGTWGSLNWITVPQVRRVCREDLRCDPWFDSDMLYQFVIRVLSDEDFQRRRGALMCRAFGLLERLKLTALLRRVPVSWQPAMNCVVTRP